MKNKLSENIKQLVDQSSLSVSELARRAGMPQPVLHKLYSGDTTNPNVNSLRPIANYFNVSISQLIGDEQLFNSRTNEVLEKWHDVPLLAWDSINKWVKSPTQKPTHEMIRTNASVSDKAFALEIREELETLTEGTIIIVDPEINLENNDFVVAQKKGQNKASVKHAIFNDGEMYLKSLIKKPHVAPSTRDEFELFGVIIQYKKKALKCSNSPPTLLL